MNFASLWSIAYLAVLVILVLLDAYVRYLGYPGETAWKRILWSSLFVSFVISLLITGVWAIFQ